MPSLFTLFSQFTFLYPKFFQFSLVIFSQAKTKSVTQSQSQTSTNIQSDIHSSTELNGDDPLFPDDDEDIFDKEETFKQLDTAESSSKNFNRSKSPQNIANVPKPKESALKLTPKGSATQTSESLATINAKSNENPEKRQRSLLDSLDDAYYKETPSKMKRESNSPSKRFPCSKPNTIVTFLDKSMQVSKKNESGDDNSSPESTDPESADINSENDQPPNENDVNSESIKEMDNGLESLHVVSQSSKESGVDSDGVVPATPPSTKSQRSMFDYFKKS